jgi:hypothetical protein
MSRAHGSPSIIVVFTLVLLAVATTVSAQTPTQFGTSGGNINDISKVFCCSGTLGALVESTNGTQYILSNNHVLARTNAGKFGDPIIQPGLVDQTPVCAKDTNDTVANLSAFVPISFRTGTPNRVDAAIAQLSGSAMDTTGRIAEIGLVSSSTVAPTLELNVQKMGRTTGHTTGSISTINVTVDIGYSKQCGIGSQKARFVNQIAITGTDGPFSAGGDSGALVVDNASCPQPVGLLFAGSNSITLVNPITTVLDPVNWPTIPGLTIVGGCPLQAESNRGFFARLFAWLKPPAFATPAFAAQGSHPDPAAVAHATHVKERHENALLKVPGVLGAGVGLSDTAPGQVVIEIFVERLGDDVRNAVPPRLDSVPVKLVETGPIIAHCADRPDGDGE